MSPNASRRDRFKYPLPVGTSVGPRWALAAALGLGAAVFCGPGVAWGAPDSETGPGMRPVGSKSVSVRAARPPTAKSTTGRPRPQPATRSTAPTGRRVAAASSAVSVSLPPMPIRDGWSFTVSNAAVAAAASDYVAAGGDPSDNARFFFGDLAVTSLDTLAGGNLSSEQVRVELGNLAVSGYFGGVWLRDNLRGTPAVSGAPLPGAGDLTVSAIGMRIFDALAVGLTGLADAPPWLATTAARVSVPAMLALYGYNRGYLEFLLENPPAGVPSMRDTLSCNGFLACSSTAFPMALADRYEAAIDDLADPPSLPWLEMSAWSSIMEGATGAGRFVWGIIAGAGGFSPDSYAALVDLSSAYLMVGKTAVLSSMTGYAADDAAVARSALLLQAGLWMWSGAYFAGLASGAPRGTMPTINTPTIVTTAVG